MSNNQQIEGIPLPRTEEWIAANTEFVAPFEWTRLTGGTSNLTFAIRDARGERAVVRRPPTGKLLPKAHDMEREHKILFGLAGTKVRAARPYAVCRDTDVAGAPFYVMEFVDGSALISPESIELAPTRIEIRRRIGESMIDALVELHTVDPADVGLADLGRHEDYIARQLNRWADSWRRSHEAAQIDFPQLEAIYEALSQRIPEQGPARICHGDCGLHNVLISDAGEIRALTDWEISTLGDPLADAGYFLHSLGKGRPEEVATYLDRRLDEGYSTRGELLARYEERSGRKIADPWFYFAFSAFKITCIVQGVYARFRAGVRGTQGVDLEGMRTNIIDRIQLAAALVER